MTHKFDLDFVFYHIPKCGGTSCEKFLKDLFLNFYDARNIIAEGHRPRHLTKDQDIQKFLNKYSEKQLKEIKIILCHIQYKNPLSQKNLTHTARYSYQETQLTE